MNQCDYIGMTEKIRRILDSFLKYRSQLSHSVGKIVRKEDIEDIVQETFVKSYEADLKQEIQYPKTYMLRTAKNLALNHVSTSSYKCDVHVDDVSAPIASLNTRSLESEFESKERFLLFCRATDQLSGSVRQAFILKKVYGWSQKKIAECLNLSESTVEKHIAKGLFLTAQYIRQKQEETKQTASKKTNVKAATK
jgi:RNA polymerase sigma-70 factor (ECF subfamily)